MKIGYPKHQFHNFSVTRHFTDPELAMAGYYEHNFTIDEVFNVSNKQYMLTSPYYTISAKVTFFDQTSTMADLLVEEDDPFLLFMKENYPERFYI